MRCAMLSSVSSGQLRPHLLKHIQVPKLGYFFLSNGVMSGLNTVKLLSPHFACQASMSPSESCSSTSVAVSLQRTGTGVTSPLGTRAAEDARKETDRSLDGRPTSVRSLSFCTLDMFPDFVGHERGQIFRAMRHPRYSVCKNEAAPPYTCQETLLIYIKRIYAELEQHVTDLYREGKVAGAGLTAGECLYNMPFFKTTSRKDLCEPCAHTKLGEILFAVRAGSWYQITRMDEQQEELSLELAAHMPLPDDQGSAGLSTYVNGSKYQPQCASRPHHRAGQIDWNDPLADCTYPSPSHAQSVGGVAVVKADTGILVRRDRGRCRKLFCDCLAGCR
jgi:hypothetical protein